MVHEAVFAHDSPFVEIDFNFNGKTAQNFVT